MADLGWWAISGDALIAALRRASSGEDPDLLYAELYANTGRPESPDLSTTGETSG